MDGLSRQSQGLSRVTPASYYKGYFSDQAALNAAIPVGAENWWTIVEDENAVYIWNVSNQEWATNGNSNNSTATIAEIPTGDKDGVNRIFEISETPLPDTLLCFRAGQALTEGIDYTISGTTITLTSDVAAPTEATNLLFYYSYRSSTPAAPSASKIEVPAGIKNGENTNFTISFAPISGTALLFKSGQALTENIDYTSSGVGITFLIAPVAEDNLLIKYNHL